MPEFILSGFKGICTITRYNPVRQAVSCIKNVKGKGFPYSLPSIGPRADLGVQAVNLEVTVSHPPGGRLPLLSARPAVTFAAAEHHCP